MEFHIDHGVISILIALLGFAIRCSMKVVGKMSDMALSLREIAINVSHSNDKIDTVIEITKDHEQRLRVLEKE